MLFNYKKVASVLASAIMLSSTVGFAAAAAYPAPFTDGGAVVYGANADNSDLTAAIDVFSDLKNKATATGVTASTTGETVGLFSSGTKIYVNDSLNTVKNVLTKADLPTVLADESFSGNVDATMTQTIDIGSNPRVTFKRQPTSDDDPTFALQTSTSTTNYIYNASSTFSKAVNFSHSDSEGEEITLFGQEFTVAAATSSTSLVLLKSAEKFTLDSDNPTKEVTIAGNTYTVELVSASDTAATIAVTDSTGDTASKEIAEAASKKINDLTIAVNTADETNLKLSASIIAGAEKVTLTSGSEITIGESDTVIDGTKVVLTGGVEAMTKLTVSIAAAESDEDAIKAGESLTDPVFGSFKVDFAGLNIPEEDSARETISVLTGGDDKMDVAFTDHRGNEKTIQFAKNWTGTAGPGMQLQHDDDGRNITVMEMQPLKYQDYVVVGNEDEGYILKLSSVNNGTTGTSNDYVKFTDVFSGDTLETTWTSDGVGTLSVGGKSYAVTLTGNSNNASEDYVVRLNYPDSSTVGTQAIIYPTIQTSKGAKVAFYEPIKNLNLTNWNGISGNLSKIRFPDGDGYSDVDIVRTNATRGWWNITEGGTTTSLDTKGAAFAANASVNIGKVNYTVTGSGANNTIDIYLQTTGGAQIDEPALVIFEEKDDASAYEALIVDLEIGATGDDGIGVNDVERTWGVDGSAWETTMASNSDMTKEGDRFGTIVSTDSGDSDQKVATISYPDEQVIAQIYVAEESAVITPGTTGGAGGAIAIVTDGEVSSVSDKNLFVIGGSCINTVAAKILGSDSPLCAEDFTAATNVGAGQYIIKTVASPYNEDKVATLVAGFEKAETVSAVARAMGGASTDVGEMVYPEST